MTLSEMVKAIYDKLIAGQSAPLGYYLYTTVSFEATGGSGGSKTVDLSGYANYAGLTDENFKYLIGCGGNHHMSNPYNGNGNSKVSAVSYSASSGSLVITLADILISKIILIVQVMNIMVVLYLLSFLLYQNKLNSPRGLNL